MKLNKTMNRRRFFGLTTLTGAGALLAACAPPVAAPVAPTAPAAPAASEATATPATEAPAAPRQISETNDPEAVTFWTPGGSATYCTNFDTISKSFSEKNPGVKVGSVQCGAGDQNFLEIFLARVAAGNPPDVSVIWDSPVALAARGALEPLDELMKDSVYSQVENWPPGVLASCQFQGKTYGLPVAAGTYALFYNETLFEKKGIAIKREDFPKTWADLRKISKELTVWNGDTLEQVGLVPNKIDNVELNIWSALNGSQFYDNGASKFTIDSPQNIELMEFLLTWFNEDYRGDLTALEATANWNFFADPNGRPPMWQGGKLGIGGNGFWAAGDMYGTEMAADAKKWNVAQYPVGPSGSGTKSGYWPNWMVVPKGAKRREEGFKYADYMSVEGIRVWFSAVPDLPVNKKVPAGELFPDRVANERGPEFAKDVMAFFTNQLDVATPMWNSPVQNFANDQITRMMEQVYTKQAAPKEALAEAQKACQAELDKVMKV
jgi:ABC-type glycerol-3-phosphate transport system substrate-binding protein